MENCYIVDIDGTLANLDHRLHYIKTNLLKPDWDSFFDAVDEDLPIQTMIDISNCLSEWYDIVLCSGRPEKCRERTVNWLKVNHVSYDRLYMREDEDHRQDHMIKEEFLKDIQKEYNVLAAIDDRKQVVDMWRRNGILCLQCAEGDY